jgi:hypothetical protein
MESDRIKPLKVQWMRWYPPVASVAVLVCSHSFSVFADEVTIEKVTATCESHRGGRICSFLVTLRHNDEGWHHYANRWEIISGETVLAVRILAHPHVNEQPFTRSLRGVRIPQKVTEVRVRAEDTRHGRSPHEYHYTLP